MDTLTISFAILDSKTILARLNRLKKPHPEILAKLSTWLTTHTGIEVSDYGFFLASLLAEYKESDVQLFVNEYSKWNEISLGDSPICAGTWRVQLLVDINQAIDATQFSDDVKFKMKRWISDKSKKGIMDSYALGFYLGKILTREQDATTRLERLLSSSSLDEVVAWYSSGVVK